jgi:hypothetical protein
MKRTQEFDDNEEEKDFLHDDFIYGCDVWHGIDGVYRAFLKPGNGWLCIFGTRCCMQMGDGGIWTHGARSAGMGGKAGWVGTII